VRPIAEMNAFYDSLRVPEVNEYGITTGRWKRDEHGRYVELWSQLDGQTTEQCIMNLMRIKLIIAPQITKLRNHAVYAKMVADDIKDDTWRPWPPGPWATGPPRPTGSPGWIAITPSSTTRCGLLPTVSSGRSSTSCSDCATSDRGGSGRKPR